MKPKKAEKLRCPFCGKNSVTINECYCYYAICHNCGATGPLRKTAKGAERTWKKVKPCD